MPDIARATLRTPVSIADADIGDRTFEGVDPDLLAVQRAQQLSGPVTQGLRSSAYGLAGGVEDLVGTAAEDMGLTQFADARFQEADDFATKAELSGPNVRDYRAVKDATDAVNYLGGLAGQALGSMGPVVAGSLVGGAPGAMAVGGVMNAGEQASRLRRESPGVSAHERLGNSLVYGIGAGAMDAAVPLAAGRALKGLAKPIGAAAGLAGEAITEGGQEKLGQVLHSASDINRQTANDNADIANAMIGGAVGGGALGSATHLPAAAVGAGRNLTESVREPLEARLAKMRGGDKQLPDLTEQPLIPDNVTDPFDVSAILGKHEAEITKRAAEVGDYIKSNMPASAEAVDGLVSRLGEMYDPEAVRELWGKAKGIDVKKTADKTVSTAINGLSDFVDGFRETAADRTDAPTNRRQQKMNLERDLAAHDLLLKRMPQEMQEADGETLLQFTNGMKAYVRNKMQASAGRGTKKFGGFRAVEDIANVYGGDWDAAKASLEELAKHMYETGQLGKDEAPNFDDLKTARDNSMSLGRYVDRVVLQNLKNEYAASPRLRQQVQNLVTPHIIDVIRGRSGASAINSSPQQRAEADRGAFEQLKTSLVEAMGEKNAARALTQIEHAVLSRGEVGIQGGQVDKILNPETPEAYGTDADYNEFAEPDESSFDTDGDTFTPGGAEDAVRESSRAGDTPMFQESEDPDTGDVTDPLKDMAPDVWTEKTLAEARRKNPNIQAEVGDRRFFHSGVLKFLRSDAPGTIHVDTQKLILATFKRYGSESDLKGAGKIGQMLALGISHLINHGAPRIDGVRRIREDKPFATKGKEPFADDAAVYRAYGHTYTWGELKRGMGAKAWEVYGAGVKPLKAMTKYNTGKDALTKGKLSEKQQAILKAWAAEVRGTDGKKVDEVDRDQNKQSQRVATGIERTGLVYDQDKNKMVPGWKNVTREANPTEAVDTAGYFKDPEGDAAIADFSTLRAMARDAVTAKTDYPHLKERLVALRAALDAQMDKRAGAGEPWYVLAEQQQYGEFGPYDGRSLEKRREFLKLQKLYQAVDKQIAAAGGDADQVAAISERADAAAARIRKDTAERARDGSRISDSDQKYGREGRKFDETTGEMLHPRLRLKPDNPAARVASFTARMSKLYAQRQLELGEEAPAALVNAIRRGSPEGTMDLIRVLNTAIPLDSADPSAPLHVQPGFKDSVLGKHLMSVLLAHYSDAVINKSNVRRNEQRPEGLYHDAKAALEAGEKLTPEQKAEIKADQEVKAKAATYDALSEDGKLKADVKAYIERLLGKDVDAFMKKSDTVSGEFDFVDGVEKIWIATSAASPLGVASHESMHALFRRMTNGDHSNPETRKMAGALLEAANSPVIMKQLNALLKDHPEALKQLADPEERLAYAFQFWSQKHTGGDGKGKRLLTVGPRTSGYFNKVANWLRGLFGVLSQEEQLQEIFEAFDRGRFAQQDVVPQVLQDLEPKRWWKQSAEAIKPVIELGKRVLSTANGHVRSWGIPAVSGMADQFFADRTDTDKSEGYLQARHREYARRLNRVAGLLKGTSAEERKLILSALRAGQDGGPLAEKVAGIRSMLDEAFEYMKAAGVKQLSGYTEDGEPVYVALAKVKNYFPRVYDRDAVAAKADKFVALLEQHGFKTEQAKAIVESIKGGFTASDIQENDSLSGVTFRLDASHQRQLGLIPDTELEPFLSQNLLNGVAQYMWQAARRAEYVRRFHNDGSAIHDAIEEAKKQGMTPKQEAYLHRYVQAMEGTLGHDVNEQFRQLSSGLVVYQNIRLLPLSLFSSLIDPLGIVVRGGTAQEAWGAFTRGVKGLFGKGDDADAALAKLIGTIEEDLDDGMVADLYGSQYMSGTARKLNSMFFRWNGMESWNRSMRVAATRAAVEFIKRAKTAPGEHSERHLRELGLTPDSVKLNEKGGVVIDASVQQAVNRWVDGAILRPNAADRPDWMSDPHFMLISHLKQFTYSFQKTILERVAHEVKNGNTSPFFTIMSYVPFMMAADWLRGGFMFGPAGEAHANQSLGDALWNGVKRAGLLGTGDYALNVNADLQHGGSGLEGLLGPSVEQATQLARAMGSPKDGAMSDWITRALPINAIYR